MFSKLLVISFYLILTLRINSQPGRHLPDSKSDAQMGVADLRRRHSSAGSTPQHQPSNSAQRAPSLFQLLSGAETPGSSEELDQIAQASAAMHELQASFGLPENTTQLTTQHFPSTGAPRNPLNLSQQNAQIYEDHDLDLQARIAVKIRNLGKCGSFERMKVILGQLQELIENPPYPKSEALIRRLIAVGSAGEVSLAIGTLPAGESVDAGIARKIAESALKAIDTPSGCKRGVLISSTGLCLLVVVIMIILNTTGALAASIPDSAATPLCQYELQPICYNANKYFGYFNSTL